MYEQINRKLRRIEKAIVANEAKYNANEFRTFESLEEYMLRGIALQCKLIHYSNRHARRFDAYESEVLQERMERAEIEAGWDPNP